MVSISARMQTPRILWGSLIFTIVLYDLLLFMVREEIAHRPPPPSSTVLGVSVIAVAAAVMSVVIQKKQFAAALAQMEFTVNEEPGLGSVRRVVAQPEGAFSRAMVPYQTSFLKGMAIAESVALFGFLLGYLHAPMITAAAFFLLAAAVMGSKYPRVSTIKEAIERRTNAECPL